MLVVLVGCGGDPGIDGRICMDPYPAHVGVDGLSGPCRHQDQDAGSGCGSGEAVHVSLGWDGPSRLWFGPEEQAPECPYGPASISYEGHADLVAPSMCEACACEPSTGSCALPSTLTASTDTCGNFAGGTLTSFDAPAPWDGHCDDTTQVPTGAALSLTIGAVAITENGCAVAPPVPAKVIASHWKTFARACDGKDWTPGRLSRSTCIPENDPTPPGFSLCIYQNGENDCPAADASNVFTERHVFYQGTQDDRQCSACGCGSPIGSLCTGTISIYKGDNLTCSASPLVPIPVSSASTTCLDIQPPGQALGSKSAKPATYLPGTCEPMGGQPSGLAVPIHPSTLCCRP